MALDPGGTTGWACFEIELDPHGYARWDPTKMLSKYFTTGQLKAYEEDSDTGHHRALWLLLMKYRPDVVLCERFDNSGNEFAKIISAEYIGVAKCWCSCIGAKLVMQGADQAKRFGRPKVKDLGLEIKPAYEWRHANDALSHLVTYLMKREDDVAPGIRMRMLQLLKAVHRS
jgi:hypothetical protein